MNTPFHINPPTSEHALLERCKSMEGLSFSQLASRTGIAVEDNPDRRKGWIGQVMEYYLGAEAKSRSLPDFVTLGIELKTLPIGTRGKPVESTFVTTIPLLTIHQQEWRTSQCYQKLRRVLWVPVEGDTKIPYTHRRIGSALLWSPSEEDEAHLAEDWKFLTDMIVSGRLEELDATYGTYLQIRPKGANAKSLCSAYDASGCIIKTLPRGFYLRAVFTQKIIGYTNS